MPAPAAPTSISSGASKVSDVLSSIAPGEYKVFAYDNKVSSGLSFRALMLPRTFNYST